MLSFAELLRGRHEVRIWSNFLGREKRGELLDGLGLERHQAGAGYDAILVLTGDARDGLQKLDPEITALLQTTSVRYVMHRFTRVEGAQNIYLFPLASRLVLMCATGLAFSKPAASGTDREVRLLIQGNLQSSRRAYDKVAILAESSDHAAVDIVGRWWEGERPAGERVRVHANLDELTFHKTCASAHFIVPMIDPELHPQYFKTTFSSSILIGFAYCLPFIAHARLFELYPIHGYKYSNDAELQAAVTAATRLAPEGYAELAAGMATSREHLLRVSYENLMSYFD